MKRKVSNSLTNHIEPINKTPKKLQKRNKKTTFVNEEPLSGEECQFYDDLTKRNFENSLNTKVALINKNKKKNPVYTKDEDKAEMKSNRKNSKRQFKYHKEKGNQSVNETYKEKLEDSQNSEYRQDTNKNTFEKIKEVGI